MRFPALIALVSATSYLACGSSDAVRSDHDGASGEGGEAGDGGEAGKPPGSGGSNGSAGATATPSAGQGGEPPSGGAAGAGAGGEGGSGGAPDDGLPDTCPGALADYERVDGTEDDDDFVEADLQGKKLVFALAGADVFESSADGGDCLVGGSDDDHFTSPSESASYFVGGAGADWFHIDTQVNYVRIADMEAADTIGLSKATFSFLNGQVGDVAHAGQVYELAGYSAGTASLPSGEGSAIVYDPTTGELWRDDDRGLKGSNAAGEHQLGTLLNHATYQFSLDDFVLD